MKKTFLIAIIAILGIITFPFKANATVKVLNLKDTLKAENIEMSYTDYEESADQVPIYLFRGQGCTHCRDFLNYLNSILEEHGKMFKVRSYECYNNDDNVAVKKKIADFYGDTASGVPYIVIGESTFYGFSDKMEDKILNAIKEEYEAKEKYDVFDELDKGITKKGGFNIWFVAIPIIVVLVVAWIVIFIRGKKNN